MNVKNTFAIQKIDILPGSMPDLLQLIHTFVEPVTASNTTPRRDPNHPMVAMVEAAGKRDSGGGADANKFGDDMTGITNKEGRSGCDKCGAANHWKATCPHKNKTADEIAAIRARNAASPQLVEVAGNKKKEEEEPEEVWGEEDVACVSSTAGFEVPKLDPHKLYLDSCASHNQRYEAGHLSDLYQTQMGLNTISNGGPSTACEYGDILGAIEAWLVCTGIANLLSIPAIERKGFRVQSDTHADWIVTSPGGTRIVFKQDTGRWDRFPYVDLRDPEIAQLFGDIRNENIAKKQTEILMEHFGSPQMHHSDSDASFCTYIGKLNVDDWVTNTADNMEGVNLFQAGKQKIGDVLKTVRRNFDGRTKREIKEATLARLLQSRVRNMSDTTLKHMVSVNGLRNSPVRPEHVTNASRIFGPNVAALEGKTVRRPSPRVHTDGGITIPDDFHRLHHFVTLVADIFFVNGVAFLMTQSQKIKMYTVEHTPSRKASALADSLKNIKKSMEGVDLWSIWYL